MNGPGDSIDDCTKKIHREQLRDFRPRRSKTNDGENPRESNSTQGTRTGKKTERSTLRLEGTDRKEQGKPELQTSVHALHVNDRAHITENDTHLLGHRAGVN